MEKVLTKETPGIAALVPVLSFSLQHFQRLSHHRTQGRHLHDERDPALRWLEGFVNCTVLDHSAPVLDRQSVQLFQVSPKRCQCVSQLRPFRGEPLDQTRSSPDKTEVPARGRDPPVALLRCWPEFELLRRSLRSTGLLGTM